MASYIKLKVVRFKQLDDSHWELILHRDYLKNKPGDMLNIYRPDIGTKGYYIASGTQEPWMRLLINSDNHWISWFKTLKPNSSIRVLPELTNYLPNLFSISEEDAYICSDIGVGPYLSYLSTFLMEQERPVLIYHFSNNAAINLEWIQNKQDVIWGDHMPLLLHKLPKDKKRYFIAVPDAMVKEVLGSLPKGAQYILSSF